MTELGIDIETYSGTNLADGGVYRYVEDPDFAILLFAYSVDGGAVSVIDRAKGEHLPDDVREALTDPDVTKTAYNAMFERVCIGHWLQGKPLDPNQWRCTMARAAMLGFPLSLGQCAEAMGLQDGKMKEGAALIRYFSIPYKGRRRMPSESPERWEIFKQYCKRDVEVEQAILKKVRRLEQPKWEQELYVADQEINDLGVMVDTTLAKNASNMDAEYKAMLMEEAKQITHLSNPNSPAQLKEWLHQVTGFTVATLNKASLDDLGKRLGYWPTAQRVLAIRKELGKTSCAKYGAMLDSVCADQRIHGLLQYYGAARTGRWAGRLVQVQNLPQNHLEDIGVARSLVRGGDLDELMLYYSNVPQTLSELIRTAFIAAPGHTFHVCDFSAIEARVIAWLAGEDWVLDVFRKGGDIYCATASQMFGVPVEKHGQNAHLRQKGKVAVLALGYGGGVSALEAMGGARMGLTEQEEREIVYLWRRNNPRIVKLWARVESAAIAAIESGNNGKPQIVNRGIAMQMRWGSLIVTLPSGRNLCYPRAKVTIEYGDGYRGDHESIEYEGASQTTKKWESVRTYGGKLVENLVQAIARDILAHVLLQARRKGLRVVFHVHDEIVVEATPDQTLADIERIFGEPPTWCRDLPVKGAGYSTPYYLKD